MKAIVATNQAAEAAIAGAEVGAALGAPDGSASAGLGAARGAPVGAAIGASAKGLTGRPRRRKRVGGGDQSPRQAADRTATGAQA